MARYRADGPAVILGNSTSLFPAQLATYWRSRGLDVVVVTYERDVPDVLPDGTPVISSRDYETKRNRALTNRVLNPILNRMERMVPSFKSRFTRLTGVPGDSELRMPYLAGFIANAWPAAQAVLAQKPRFVFGLEVTTYGLATALCRGVPRIILPWGGDVFTYAESSPFHYALTKYSLKAIDLIVPGAVTAARHIVKRFGIPAKKVVAGPWWSCSWDGFQKADLEQKKTICAKWGIDPTATIFLNARRFRPPWGCFVALEAFMRLAAEYPHTHFILLGGLYTEEFMQTAKEKLEQAGLLPRFTLLWGDAPIEVCAELMSVADVFVSLLGRGDMRSASMVQAAKSGGVPVVSDMPEYREMERLGFAALLVRPDSADEVFEALRFCIQNPEKVADFPARNEAYIAEHEDYYKQMAKLLGLIDSVCATYERR